MALLRSFGRIIQAFGKSSIACQIEYIRGLACPERIRGYVTATQRFSFSNAILDTPDISNDNPTFINDFTVYLQYKFNTLCRLKLIEIQNRDLLRIVKNYDSSVTTEIDDSKCLLMLRCSGNMLPNVSQEKRRNLTNQIWNLLNEKLPQLTLEHYNVLLSIYAQNLQIVDPKKFLDSMKVKPDVTTYQLLLNVAAKCGDVESSLYVLSLMKKMGYSLSASIFHSLIEAHTIGGDVKSALSALETMRDSNIEPNIETYAVVARVHALTGDIESITKTLNAHELSTEQILEIVKSLSISGHGKHIPEILKFLRDDMDEADYTVISKITELTHAGKYEDALEIINRVVKIDCTGETNLLIHHYLENLVGVGAQIDEILDITNRLMVTKKYSLAMIDVCEAALRSQERELTMAIFEAMHEKSMVIRPHYYWPLLIAISKKEGEAGIFYTIKHMLRLNVQLNHDTLSKFVFPFVNMVNPLVTFRKFNDLGVGISVILTPLVCHLLSDGNIKDTLSLCSRANSTIDFPKILIPLSIAYKINRNVYDCAQLFKYAPRNKPYFHEFLKILRDGKLCENDTTIVSKFLQAFQILGIPEYDKFRSGESQGEMVKSPDGEATNFSATWRLQKKITHPRDMSTDELECHLIELRSKGLNIRGVLRKLLMELCRENNVARVDEIVKEYNENGFLWTSGMYACLLLFHIKNDRTKEALNLYRELRKHHTDFKIDDFKILDLSRALIKENQIDEAIAILKSARSKGGPLIAKQCWKLLDTVAHSSRSEMTENILDILVNAGYCERTNTILGPLVRPHLLKNDLAKAVEIFKKCAECYQCAPLHQELVDALIKAINENDSTKDEMIELLDGVQTIMTRLLGIDITKMNLFIGFVKNGMREESRNFFKTQSVPTQVFINGLGAIPDGQKIEVFTDILECSNLSRKTRDFLYEACLSVYCETSDCQSAIKLWRKMSKELKVPSQAFMMNFINLLKKHNVSLPEDYGES